MFRRRIIIGKLLFFWKFDNISPCHCWFNILHEIVQDGGAFTHFKMFKVTQLDVTFYCMGEIDLKCHFITYSWYVRRPPSTSLFEIELWVNFDQRLFCLNPIPWNGLKLCMILLIVFSSLRFRMIISWTNLWYINHHRRSKICRSAWENSFKKRA